MDDVFDYVESNRARFVEHLGAVRPHDEANHAPNESTTLEGFVNGIRSTAAALFELSAS